MFSSEQILSKMKERKKFDETWEGHLIKLRSISHSLLEYSNYGKSKEVFTKFIVEQDLWQITYDFFSRYFFLINIVQTLCKARVN